MASLKSPPGPSDPLPRSPVSSKAVRSRADEDGVIRIASSGSSSISVSRRHSHSHSHSHIIPVIIDDDDEPGFDLSLADHTLTLSLPHVLPQRYGHPQCFSLSPPDHHARRSQWQSQTRRSAKALPHTAPHPGLRGRNTTHNPDSTTPIHTHVHVHTPSKSTTPLGTRRKLFPDFDNLDDDRNVKLDREITNTEENCIDDGIEPENANVNVVLRTPATPHISKVVILSQTQSLVKDDDDSDGTADTISLDEEYIEHIHQQYAQAHPH